MFINCEQRICYLVNRSFCSRWSTLLGAVIKSTRAQSNHWLAKSDEPTDSAYVLLPLVAISSLPFPSMRIPTYFPSSKMASKVTPAIARLGGSVVSTGTNAVKCKYWNSVILSFLSFIFILLLRLSEFLERNFVAYLATLPTYYSRGALRSEHFRLWNSPKSGRLKNTDLIGLFNK